MTGRPRGPRLIGGSEAEAGGVANAISNIERDLLAVSLVDAAWKRIVATAVEPAVDQTSSETSE